MRVVETQWFSMAADLWRVWANTTDGYWPVGPVLMCWQCWSVDRVITPISDIQFHTFYDDTFIFIFQHVNIRVELIISFKQQEAGGSNWWDCEVGYVNN